MTIQFADVRQHLHALIQEIFPNGSNSHCWAPAWNLVLGLMRRYSSTGITMAILRAEAHRILDAIQSTRWQPLNFVSASSHDCRCRVRVHDVQPLRPSSPTLVATLSDLDEICTRTAFIHRRYARWALQWKGSIMRLGGVRMAASRILPTEQVVEEITAKAFNDLVQRDGLVVAGRIVRRRDLPCGGSCLTLKSLDASREIQWVAPANDAPLSLLVFAGDIVVIEDFERETADDGSVVVTTLFNSVVRVLDDTNMEAVSVQSNDEVIASQFNDALSQVSLASASSQRCFDQNLLDAIDFDGQRPTIQSILDTKGPVVNVSLTAIIHTIDREQMLCYIRDASRATLAISLSFDQVQTWESGQTLFAYRLTSGHTQEILTTKPGGQIYNLCYALGLLASPNLYWLVNLDNRPRSLFSMFVCKLLIKKIDVPHVLAHRWHESVQLVVSDGDLELPASISYVAMESLLKCSLAVFTGLKQASKAALLTNVLNQDMMALVSTTTQSLRLEMLRPVSGINRPSVSISL